MSGGSDCAASWEDGPGPLSVGVESTVASLFGKAIAAAAGRAAAACGATRGTLSVKDEGALDAVVEARVEACLRKSGFAKPAPRPLPAAHPASPRDRPRRSRLYLPGNQPELLPNAGLFGADCLILDLEDSVAPARKEEARVLARWILDKHRSFFADSEVMVRINPLSGPWGRADLEELLPSLPDALILPKCESAGEVLALDELLAVEEGRLGLPRGRVHLLPLIETARGLLAAAAIAAASPRVAALCFGAEDFRSDIGALRSPSGTETLAARQLLVIAAKAAGVQALDSVFSDTGDEEGFASWCAASRGLGFDGIGLVHPRQVAAANAAFSPSEAELEEARLVVAALEEAEARGLGVASLGGKMVDAPVAARARRLLSLGVRPRDGG